MSLHIGVGEDGTVVQFSPDVVHGIERRWYLDQVRPFLENPDSIGPALVARHFPRVWRSMDRDRWQALHLEYGILELMPGTLGHEWSLFPLHLHRGPRRTPFSAVIEILNGHGGIFMQRVGSFDRVQEASVVWVRHGDQLLLPPGHGHTVMNSGPDPLVVAEVHSSDTVAEFDEWARHRGAAYYFGPQGVRANPHYRGVPALKEIQAENMTPPNPGGHDLYQGIMARPERFHFLHPY